jgi:gliding motility-associated-like protein
MRKKIIYLLSFFVVSGSTFSQLAVTTNNVAASLAQQITGNGVKITNPNLNCYSLGAGTFTYTGPDLGLANGILLTVGIANQVMIPYATSFLNTTTGNNYFDPDLLKISGAAFYDVCILQFDFTPVCDTMKVSYVFGSDEYPENLVSYNDAFGIFLTGANPSGGSYSAQNMATLPNGTEVEVNKINGGWPIGTGASNPAYFVENYPLDHSNTHNIAYYGYTIPITSIMPVVCGSPYHMKIGIADANNPHYDSGVFIKGNSVTCKNSTPVVSAVNNSPTICNGIPGSGVATVSNYTGPAPTFLWTPGGMTTDTITNLLPGIYNCNVLLQSPCGWVDTETVSITVPENTPFKLLARDTDYCAGASVALTITGGGNATYSWSPVAGLKADTGATVTTHITSNTTYTIIGINGNCSDTVFLQVKIKPLPVLVAMGGATIPGGKSAQLNASGGGTYLWAPSTGLSCSTCPNPVASPLETTRYCVTLTNDSTQCEADTCISIEVNCADIFVPSAFSPNGDGQNDHLFVRGTACLSDFNFYIYDRWGEQVYKSDDPNGSWDGGFRGRLMDSAVFIYYLTATLPGGQKITKRGNITLLR